jgi:outer membrane lipoprotein
MRRVAVAVVLMVALGGAACMRPPAELTRGPFAALVPSDLEPDALQGQRVRWGGEIVDVTPTKRETCLEVLARPLDCRARPRETDESYGRFLACRAGFYDPAVYEVGREVTIAGTAGRPVVGKVGEYDYRYPVVEAEAIHLWPERVERYPSFYYGFGLYSEF